MTASLQRDKTLFQWSHLLAVGGYPLCLRMGFWWLSGPWFWHYGVTLHATLLFGFYLVQMGSWRNPFRIGLGPDRFLKISLMSNIWSHFILKLFEGSGWGSTGSREIGNGNCFNQDMNLHEIIYAKINKKTRKNVNKDSALNSHKCQYTI